MNPHNICFRICGVAVVATLSLFAGACSSDKDSKSETTTTVKSDETSETIPATASDEAYSAMIAELSSQIADAGTDVCALTDISALGPPAPKNSKQTEENVRFYVEMYNAIAGVLPAEFAAESEFLRMATRDLQAEMQAAGYPPDFMFGDIGDKVLSGDVFISALTVYQNLYRAQCDADLP